VIKLDNNGNPIGSFCTDPTTDGDSLDNDDCNTVLGANPIGITATTDINGNSYMWVVNYTTARVTKLRLDGSLVTSLQVGSTPYTYSDMAGYMLRAVTYRGGTWTVNLNSGFTAPTWRSLTWDENQSLGSGDGVVRVRVRTALTEAGLAAAPWYPGPNTYYEVPPADLSALPKEQWLQIEVDLRLAFDDTSPTFDNLKVEMGY
jgi:hypothetical protein